MKCPFCGSVHVLKDGFDEQSMDIWRCMACGETITQADLDKAKEDHEFHMFLVEEGLIKGEPWERPDRGG